MQSVREKEHQGLQDFCGKADCLAGLDSFDQELGKNDEMRAQHGPTILEVGFLLSWSVKTS